MMALSTLVPFLALIQAAYSGSQPFIWPLPVTHEVSADLALNVDESTFTFGSMSDSQILKEAFTRYADLMFPHRPDGNGDPSMDTLKTLNVKVDDDSGTLPSFEMDESYKLTVSGDAATLSAKTVWGALRGLETFSQMVIFNSSLNYYQAYKADITDAPRFPHRGILIDTSRHFQSVTSIKSVLDSMSYCKFNVLHWHIVDFQSFPFESKAFPKLWDGSYTQYERYTQNDVRDIIEYATARGIRVIPEFDIPGDSSSWCIGYPDICPSASCQSPLNPAVNATWDLLEGLIAEVSQLFPDDHLLSVHVECY